MPAGSVEVQLFFEIRMGGEQCKYGLGGAKRLNNWKRKWAHAEVGDKRCWGEEASLVERCYSAHGKI